MRIHTEESIWLIDFPLSGSGLPPVLAQFYRAYVCRKIWLRLPETNCLVSDSCVHLPGWAFGEAFRV